MRSCEVIILVAAVVAILLVSSCRRWHARVDRVAARHAAVKDDLPSEWSWCNITIDDADIYYRLFGVRIAVGDYASPVFDQHMSNWCGCCYLVAAIQMLQDRMHIVLGITAPSMRMFPCFQFNMQLALDTYNAYEKRMRGDNWNACTGGMPSRVLNAIKEGHCLVRLTSNTGIWHGHPLKIDAMPADAEENVSIDELEALEMAPRSIMKRILKYGPVVLGINSLCLRDPKLPLREGLIDTEIIAPRDHAVTVIGWKRIRKKTCWIVRNSWGTQNVPLQRPDPGCVGDDFNRCTVTRTEWIGDPLNPGYAYVPITYDGLRGYPSCWYDAIPTRLQVLVPRSSEERQDILSSPNTFGHYSPLHVGPAPR